MKRKTNSLILLLPALLMLGVHLFGHTETVAASDIHHRYAYHAVHIYEFSHADVHDVGFVHGSENHGVISAANIGHHFNHPHANNSAGKTWSRAQWAKSSKWDEQARQDMIARIVRDGWNWTSRADSFGKQSNWLPGWELRWWSFTRNDGGTVWVYHARSKSTGQRYTSFTNHTDGKLQQWEIAR